MILQFASLPELRGPEGAAYFGRLPLRMRYLEPTAAAALMALEMDTGGLVYTDMYRTPEASFAAKNARPTITKAPGKSGHNFGLSVDLDVEGTLAHRGWKYSELLSVMSDHGWHCHRLDGKQGMHESYHFNHLGPDPATHLLLAKIDDHNTWDDPVEGRIQELYGKDFDLSTFEIQHALATKGLYLGKLDGDIGPMSQKAIRTFQGAWGLTVDGVPGPMTQRLLALVTAIHHVTRVPEAAA